MERNEQEMEPGCRVGSKVMNREKQLADGGRDEGPTAGTDSLLFHIS